MTGLLKGAVDSRSHRAGAPALPLLVETRFGVPVAGPATLHRAGVSALLDAYADRRVTVVAAPTGFGKTTAIAAWVRSRPEPSAWLTLEVADAVDEPDQRRLVAHVHGQRRRRAVEPDVAGRERARQAIAHGAGDGQVVAHPGATIEGCHMTAQ